VILAPWGLKGVLDMADLTKICATNVTNGAINSAITTTGSVGQHQSIDEIRRRQVWRDWARFYPLLETALDDGEEEEEKEEVGSDDEGAGVLGSCWLQNFHFVKIFVF